MNLVHQPAYRQLLDLGRRGGTLEKIEDREPWRIGSIDDNARPAAVLVLFGALDDQPALSTGHDPLGQVGADLDLLFVQRAGTLRSHPGQVAFPGGRVDPEDGDPQETVDCHGVPVAAAQVRAALREAQEETGVDPEGVDVLGTFTSIPLPVSNHLVTPVLGWWTEQSPVAVVDRAESTRVFRAPVLDLLEPANRFTAVVERGGARYLSPAFEVPLAGTDESAVIWGFTGVMVNRVLDELGWTRPWDRSHRRPAPMPPSSGRN